MAIRLPKPELGWEGNKTEYFFAVLEAVNEKMNSFKDIRSAVERNSHLVLRYSIKKMANLAGEKLGCQFEGRPTQRKSLDWRTSKSIILSDHFGAPKVENLTRFTSLIKAHVRTKIFPGSAKIYSDIGENYYEHMEGFFRLLEDMSRMERRRRSAAMTGINLSERFIDRFVGQFVHTFFWTMFDFGHFPKNYYKLIR